MIKIDEELLDIEGIKKSNKPLIELFIRRTAVLTSTPEYLVEKIIKDQWSHANKVTQAGNDISELDFCNLGTFFISQKKAKKRITRIEKIQSKMDQSASDNEKINKRREVIKQNNLDTIKSIKLKTKQLENEN